MITGYDQKKLGLVEGLEEFSRKEFQSKDYTDLTIRCQDKEFYVHKLVVCLFSGFFANACKPDSPFKEAKTGVIELHEDDPVDVQLMLECFYSEHYDIEDTFYHHYPDLTHFEALVLRDVRLYAIADKYQSYDAKRNAKSNFHDRLNRPTIGSMMPLNVSGFINVAKKVFETTPESDRELRNLFFLFTRKYLAQCMTWSHFLPEMDKIDGFWSGFAHFTTFFDTRLRVCPACGFAQKNKFEEDDIRPNGDMSMLCNSDKCNWAFGVDKWNKPIHTLSEAEMRTDPDCEPSQASYRKRKRLDMDEPDENLAEWH